MSKICKALACNSLSVAKGLCKRHWHKARRYGSPERGADWRRGESLTWLLDHVGHGGDECLTWPFTRSTSGYGVIYIDRKQRQAHREICARAHGPAPSNDHFAAHNCGKGHEGCVNQRHLRWATPAENQADRIIHGTSSRGNGNGCAKLSPKDVFIIRQKILSGVPQAKIAREYSVSSSAVHLIKSGRNWNWLKEKTT